MSALRRPAGRAISAWNSWATGCSASPSPKCSSDVSRGAGGRALPASGGTRSPGKLRRDRHGLGCRSLSEARRRRGACRRAAQPDRSWRMSAKRSSARSSSTAATRPPGTLVERAFQELVRRPAARSATRRARCRNGRRGRGLPPPTYSVVEQIGPDHAPKFRMVVKVKGAENEFGSGTSKRTAEQAAARSLLMQEGVWTEEDHGAA